MEPDQPLSRARLGRQLVVLSLATGLVLGGAVAAVAAWAGGTPSARAISDSVADSRREGDTFAEARRDALAERISNPDGVLDVNGRREPVQTRAKGVRVVTLSVAMSSDATSAEVGRVLDAARTSSLVLPRDHFLKIWPDVVVTLETGTVTFGFGGRFQQCHYPADVDSTRLPRYRVLTGPDDAEFCYRVSEALELGYELHAGPALTTKDGVAYVAQAVVWPGGEPPLRA